MCLIRKKITNSLYVNYKLIIDQLVMLINAAFIIGLREVYSNFIFFGLFITFINKHLSIFSFTDFRHFLMPHNLQYKTYRTSYQSISDNQQRFYFTRRALQICFKQNTGLKPTKSWFKHLIYIPWSYCIFTRSCN